MKATRNTSHAYIEAALEVVAKEGVDGLTMRKVANQLDVSPMAVYKHFADKEALLSAALDVFIARADVYPADSLPWQQWVESVGNGMYQALCREITWVPVLGSLKLGEEASAVTAAFIDKLVLAGFDSKQALRAYFALIEIVIGSVCLRSSLQRSGLSADAEMDPLAAGLPLLIAGLESLPGVDQSRKKGR